MENKRIIATIIAAVLCVSCAGCGNNPSASTSTSATSSRVSTSSSSEVSFPSTYHFDPPASYPSSSEESASSNSKIEKGKVTKPDVIKFCNSYHFKSGNVDASELTKESDKSVQLHLDVYVTPGNYSSKTEFATEYMDFASSLAQIVEKSKEYNSITYGFHYTGSYTLGIGDVACSENDESNDFETMLFTDSGDTDLNTALKYAYKENTYFKNHDIMETAKSDTDSIVNNWKQENGIS